MKRPLFLLHPLFIFLLSLVALGLSYFFYIHWYLKVNDSVNAFTGRFPVYKGVLTEPGSFSTIFTISVLLAIIIAGLATIFVYYQKTIQLYQSQENFINNFTHELKTPVASLKLYLETFLKYDLSKEEKDKFTNFMLKDTERLSSNINQILQLARLENKREPYERVPTDMANFLEKFLKNSEHIFRETKITLHNELNKDILYPINEKLFDNVVINLLTNAMKYSTRPPEIHISLYTKGRFLFMSFKDNGVGLKKEDEKKIFKKFYQVRTTGVPTQTGSGLGLYLTSQIVKLHKGKIWAKSLGPEMGTTITIRFPLHKVATQDRQKEKDPTYV